MSKWIYHIKSDKAPKKENIIQLNTQHAMLAQLKALIKQIIVTNLAQANARQVRVLRYDFVCEGHANESCASQGQSK